MYILKEKEKKKTIETTGPSQTLQQKTLVLCWHQTLYKTSTGIYPHADDFLLKPTNRQEQQTNPYRHFQCFMGSLLLSNWVVASSSWTPHHGSSSLSLSDQNELLSMNMN